MANVLGKIFSMGAEKLVGAIGDAFDKNFTNKEEKAKAEAEIQKIITAHVQEMERLSNEQFKNEVEDRASARNRQVDYVKALGRADYFQYFIGAIPVLGLPVLLYYILTYEIPPKNEHIAMLIIGEVLGFLAAIYNYHFGSSQGSRMKDQIKDFNNPK